MKILRFEPLEERSIEAIVAIENAANQAPWSDRAFRNELSNPQSFFRVAIGDGKVVGYGGYWRCIDEAHITNIAVDPAVRRQGVGWKLMVELLTHAQESGLTCSTLEVRAGNLPAIKLYEKLGYRTIARRKRYYPDNREDALVMWLYELDRWEPPRRSGSQLATSSSAEKA